MIRVQNKKSTLCGVTTLVVASVMFCGASFAQFGDVSQQRNNTLQVQGRSNTSQTQQVQGRINQLEKQVQTLSRAVYRGKMPSDLQIRQNMSIAKPNQGTLANLEIRLSDLENQLRQMTGQMEKQNHDMMLLQEKVDRLLSSNGRSSGLKIGGGYSSNQTVISDTGVETIQLGHVTSEPLYKHQTVTTVPNQYMDKNPTVKTLGTVDTSNLRGHDVVSVDAGKTPISMTPQKLYEQGFTLIRSADYASAQKKFEDFLRKYPDHTLAPNAQYWLSETHYVRADYRKSAKYFAKGYQKYPKSNKAADNLLKLGLSLARLDNKDDACLTFKQLDKEFATSAKNIIRRAEQERKRLNCP